MNELSSRPVDVYGIGNAIVDILTFADESLLETFELSKGSMTLMDSDRQAQVLQKLEGKELRLASGGSAANTMIGLAQSGGTGFFCGKVTHDPNGEFYRRDMIESGIQFEVEPAPEASHPTGTCVVLTTTDAERTMCTHLGVSTSLTADDVDAEHIAQCQFSYIEGYLWDSEGPRAACKKAMQHSKESGTKVAFTVSDAFLIDRFKTEFEEVLAEYCDVLFCNADEAKMLCETQSLEKCATKLAEIAPLVFMTNSEDGCYVIENGESKHVEGFKIDAVDAVGAGDAFAGGVLYGLTHGKNPVESARWGNFLASKVVSIVGPRLSEEVKDQVEQVVSA